MVAFTYNIIIWHHLLLHVTCITYQSTLKSWQAAYHTKPNTNINKTRALLECKLHQCQILIWDLNPDLQTNPDPDLDVCLIAPKVYWIHSLLGMNHFSIAKYRKNWPVTDCMRNANKSPKILHATMVREMEKWSRIHIWDWITTTSLQICLWSVWPRAMTSWLPKLTNDHFNPLSHGPLVPTGIKILFQNIVFTSMVTAEQMEAWRKWWEHVTASSSSQPRCIRVTCQTIVSLFCFEETRELKTTWCSTMAFVRHL